MIWLRDVNFFVSWSCFLFFMVFVWCNKVGMVIMMNGCMVILVFLKGVCGILLVDIIELGVLMKIVCCFVILEDKVVVLWFLVCWWVFEIFFIIEIIFYEKNILDYFM